MRLSRPWLSKKKITIKKEVNTEVEEEIKKQVSLKFIYPQKNQLHIKFHQKKWKVQKF